MQNGNYEKLIDQITDMVLAKLGGDDCPTFCHADVQRIVDAGAERIGIVLGETATALRTLWSVTRLEQVLPIFFEIDEALRYLSISIDG